MYFQPYGDEQQLNLNWIINEIINLHKQLDPDYETPSFTQVYPYSNLNRLNLDWILSELKALKELAPEPTPTIDIQAVAEALVAPPFDSNTSYQIYDFISRDGEIWRATEAIAAGGAWDETKWFKTKIGTDLAVLERWINAINNSLTSLQNTVADLSSADISDDSDAGGATVKASLNLLKGSLNNIETGIAIIVDGDTCQTAIPSGGYAYIKNNTHGLTEGLYTNTSTAVFPTSGGVANSSVFTSAQNALGDIGFGSWVDSNGLRYRKSKRFVEINIYRNFTDGGASPITISAWGIYSLGTIQDFSTNYSIAFPCLYLDSNNSRQLAFISVSTTGEVVITNNSGSGITLKDVMAYNVVITNT